MDGPLRCVTHIVFFERKSGRKTPFSVWTLDCDVNFLLETLSYCKLKK